MRLTSRQIAIKQAADLIKVERLASFEIRKTLTRFKRVALQRAGSGKPSIITQKEIAGMVKTLGRAITAAEVLGRKRVRSLVPAFGGLDDIIDEASTAIGNSKALQIVTDFTSVMNNKISDFTLDLVRQNLPTSAMKKLLGEEFEKLGLSSTNAYQLENIARTYTQLSYNAAKFREEQQDYIQEILWGYTYVTVGDERVREEHERLDGVTLPKDDPFWRRFYPPNGYSCRCAVIPVFEKQKIKRPPGDAAPDQGFDGSPNSILGIGI